MFVLRAILPTVLLREGGGPKELIILDGAAHAQFSFATDQGGAVDARDSAVYYGALNLHVSSF